MSGPGYVWIVTEQALEAKNIPDGVIGMRLKNGHNETIHVLDSLDIIGMAFKTAFANNSNLKDPPNDCNLPSDSWDINGTHLYEYVGFYFFLSRKLVTYLFSRKDFQQQF